MSDKPIVIVIYPEHLRTLNETLRLILQVVLALAVLARGTEVLAVLPAVTI